MCTRFTFVILVLAAVACGDAGGFGKPDAAPMALLSIAVEPVDQELTIDGSEPAISKYTAIGTFADGHTEDISDRVGFTLADPQLGAFLGRDFKSGVTHGGRTRVVAEYAGARGETGITLRIKQRYKDPNATGLPTDPEAPFSGPVDIARAPDVVYPNDGVLLPPNLGKLEVHFLPGTNNTLFEIAFSNDLTDVRVYTRCMVPLNGGCIYTPDATVWKFIAETNRGGSDVVVRTRATDDAGTGVGTSTDIKLAFSFENVKGGIYYWSTTEAGIMRFDFASATQTAAEKFVGPEKAGGKCVGCHTISRDGKKMVAAAGGWDVEDSLLVDVKTATRMGTPVQTAFMSWSPNAQEYVGVYAWTGATTHNLILVDGTTGVQKGTIDVGATATNTTSHPDWSPDGNSIVYVRVGAANEDGVNNQRFYGGSIHMVTKQGNTFGSPTTIVPEVAGKNSYYPSFSPDNQLLAFTQSTCPATPDRSCNADSDPTATTHVIAPQAGATPIALARANAPGKTDTATALTNSWPKWAPFEFQRTQDVTSRVVWMTFSSTRNYGLRAAPSGASGESTSGSLIWMVAIDPDKAAAGQDPSVAAFALPFQDVTSSNHIAQWTEEVLVLQ